MFHSRVSRVSSLNVLGFIRRCLLLRLSDLLGNSVQFLLSNLGNLATSLLVLIQHLDLLQSLQSLADNGSRGLGVVVWSVATAKLASVDALKSTNASALVHVDVTSDSSYKYQLVICFHVIKICRPSAFEYHPYIFHFRSSRYMLP